MSTDLVAVSSPTLTRATVRKLMAYLETAVAEALQPYLFEFPSEYETRWMMPQAAVEWQPVDYLAITRDCCNARE